MPAQSQQARHGGHAGHFLEPIDDQRLEEGREARAGLAPGDPDLLDAVVGTLHPGHLREQDGGVLAGVEVPPATRQVIVAGAEPAALGARPLLGRAGDVDADLAVAAILKVELGLRDGPRGLDAEDSLVEVFVSHAQGERRPRQRPSRAPGCQRAPWFLSEWRCSPRRYATARPRPEPWVKAGEAAERSEGSLEARGSGARAL